MKVVLVLPTYNESENIKIVLTKLQDAFKKIKEHNMHILVVDDNSPDGTAKIVKKLQPNYKNISLLMGSKQGLGVAYKRGFNYAMDKLKAEVIFEMDSDLSHPPNLIPKFMKKIDAGKDFVIGSRYIKGGATPDWPFYRKMISSGGNFLARFVSGLFKVHDCTSGFRAIRTSLLKKIKLDELESAGYSFQITLLHEAFKQKAKFAEIPLVFYDRQNGDSKISKFDIIEFFLNVFKMRLKTFNRVIKFGIVGGVGVIINMIVLWFLTDKIGMNYLHSSPIAVELAILFNFTFNNIWTFKKNNNKSSLMTKLSKFHMASFGGFAINYGILVFLTEYFGMFYLLSNLIGILIAFVWNYYVNLKWTWKGSKSYDLKKK